MRTVLFACVVTVLGLCGCGDDDYNQDLGQNGNGSVDQTVIVDLAGD